MYPDTIKEGTGTVTRGGTMNSGTTGRFLNLIYFSCITLTLLNGNYISTRFARSITLVENKGLLYYI